MDKHRKEEYLLALQLIMDAIPGWAPTSISVGQFHNFCLYLTANIYCLPTDMEMAQRQAFEQMFPAAQMCACWFHYSQAIVRKAKVCIS